MPTHKGFAVSFFIPALVVFGFFTYVTSAHAITETSAEGVEMYSSGGVAGTPGTTSTKVCVDLPSVLFLGSRGTNVTLLQDFLRTQGLFPEASTGYFGFRTQAAVMEFQRSRGLEVVGSVGPQTRLGIRNLTCTFGGTTDNTPSTQGTTGGTPSGTAITKVNIVVGPSYLDGPITVPAGSSVDLGWSSTKSDGSIFYSMEKHCVGRSSSGTVFSGPYVPTGNMTVSPTISTTYTIVCGTSNVSDSATVNVTGSAPAGGGSTSGGSQLPPLTTASCVMLTVNLVPGMTSPDVAVLQNFLKARGYFTAGITNYYGSVTAAAVTAFQAANGIETTGTVGPMTRATIAGMTCATTTGGNTPSNPSAPAAPVTPTAPATSSTPATPFTPSMPGLTADIKVNGSDGPVTLTARSPIVLTWSSVNTTSCSLGAVGETGRIDVGVSGSVTYTTTGTYYPAGNITFGLLCLNANNYKAMDFVTVNVPAASTGGGSTGTTGTTGTQSGTPATGGSYPAGCTSNVGVSTTTGQLCSGTPVSAQSQSGVGTLSAITSISPIPSSAGAQQIRINSSALLSRYNVAFVSQDNPFLPGVAAPFDSVVSTGAYGFITINLGGVSGAWSVRVTDPVTYATSPWYNINVIGGTGATQSNASLNQIASALQALQALVNQLKGQ